MANSYVVYVDGDRTKTPVDPTKEPVGTALVLVTPDGRDIHYIQGKVVITDPAKQKAEFAKMAAAYKAHDKSEG